MTAIVTGSQVRQNEERAGRCLNPAPHLPKSEHRARVTCGNPLLAGQCPICEQTHRTLQGFVSTQHPDQTYWAACGNCGHWERL